MMDTREDTSAYYPGGRVVSRPRPAPASSAYVGVGAGGTVSDAGDTREDTGGYYPGGTVVPVGKVPSGSGGVNLKGVEVKTNTIGNLREAVKDLAKALGATVVSVFVAMVACGAEVQTAKLADFDLNSNPTVVTNVTFDGLATEDAALLPVYYPEGNVTSIDQITTEGLTYSYDETNHTATLTDGKSVRDYIVVIPWKVVKDGAEYKVTAVGSKAFYGALMKSVIAPTSVTSIDDSALSYCFELTSVSLPSVTSIGNSAFNYSVHLTSVSVPSVTSIGNSAFGYCGLTSVSLPSVTSIGDSAFRHCHLLTSVDFGPTPRNTIPTLGYEAFIYLPTTCKIIIPLGMYDEWIAADGWKDLYAEGYKFVGYANAADIPKSAADIGAASTNDLAAVTSTIPETVTNVVRDVQGLVYDEKLGITWKQTMYDGNLYYVAVTNANITEVK